MTEQRGEGDVSQRAAAAAVVGASAGRHRGGVPPEQGWGGVVSVKVNSRKNNQQVLESDLYNEAPAEERPLHLC